MNNVSLYALPSEYNPLILKVNGELAKMDPSDSRIQNAKVDDLVFYKDRVISVSSQTIARREFEKTLSFEFEEVNVSTRITGYIDAMVRWPWPEGLDSEFISSFYHKNGTDEFRVVFSRHGAEIEEKVAKKTHVGHFRNPVEESPDGMRLIGGDTYHETVVDEYEIVRRHLTVDEAEKFIRENSASSKDFEVPSHLKVAWKLGSEEAILEWRKALAEIGWPKVKEQLDRKSDAALKPFFHSEGFKNNVIYLTEDDVVAHLQTRR